MKNDFFKDKQGYHSRNLPMEFYSVTIKLKNITMVFSGHCAF